MFISNIISKLSAIIYKPKIMYKATKAPTTQGPTNTLNYKSLCPIFSCSLIRALLSIYLLYFPNSYSYLSIGVLCFVGLPPVKGTSPSQRVKFGTHSATSTLMCHGFEFW